MSRFRIALRWMVYVFCTCFSAMLPQCACVHAPPVHGQITVVSMRGWQVNYARTSPAKFNAWDAANSLLH